MAYPLWYVEEEPRRPRARPPQPLAGQQAGPIGVRHYSVGGRPPTLWWRASPRGVARRSRTPGSTPRSSRLARLAARPSAAAGIDEAGSRALGDASHLAVSSRREEVEPALIDRQGVCEEDVAVEAGAAVVWSLYFSSMPWMGHYVRMKIGLPLHRRGGSRSGSLGGVGAT